MIVWQNSYIQRERVVTFYTLDPVLISGRESVVLKLMSAFEITLALINRIDIAFFYLVWRVVYESWSNFSIEYCGFN